MGKVGRHPVEVKDHKRSSKTIRVTHPSECAVARAPDERGLFLVASFGGKHPPMLVTGKDRKALVEAGAIEADLSSM